jgi:hypothetical protein
MTEADPVAAYNAAATELARTKTEYLINSVPDDDPAIEERLRTLRDEIVALLDDPDSLQKIAASKDRSEDGFVRVRDSIRNKNVKEWKDG